MNVIIADDDLSSRTILSQFMQLLPEYKIIGEVSSGEELIDLVMVKLPDIILVDINMPGLNGVEAVKSCKKILPSLQVIFITGYDEFAVDAFNLSATDYIVKPIERSRLYIALEKAKKSLELQKLQNIQRGSNRLAIKSNNAVIYLSFDDILYIEKEGRKTIIHTSNDQFDTTIPLQELEVKLPKDFYKTHRSYVINLNKINKIKHSGNTYLAFFNKTEKVAYISKLKINDVQSLMEH